MIPTFFKIRVRDKGKSFINLWIPFFIFCLPMLLIAIILLPLLIILDIFLQNRIIRGSFSGVVFWFFQLLSSLRGTEIYVSNLKENSLVEMKFI